MILVNMVSETSISKSVINQINSSCDEPSAPLLQRALFCVRGGVGGVRQGYTLRVTGSRTGSHAWQSGLAPTMGTPRSVTVRNVTCEFHGMVGAKFGVVVVGPAMGTPRRAFQLRDGRGPWHGQTLLDSEPWVHHDAPTVV